MKYDKTTVLTVPGLYEFSGIISAALKEVNRLNPSVVFAPQFSLVEDTVEIGGWQETRHPICIGRKVGHIPNCFSASTWIGVIAHENIHFAFTVDGANENYVNSLKEKLAKSPSVWLEKKPVRNDKKGSCYISLSESGCNDLFASKTTPAEKVQIISDFIRAIEELL
jgi:hypothetical protein